VWVALSRSLCVIHRVSSVIWCPYYVTEIKKIEAIQRTFTKSIGNLRLYTYHERLSVLKIDSLQCVPDVYCLKNCGADRQKYRQTDRRSVSYAKKSATKNRKEAGGQFRCLLHSGAYA